MQCSSRHLLGGTRGFERWQMAEPKEKRRTTTKNYPNDFGRNGSSGSFSNCRGFDLQIQKVMGRILGFMAVAGLAVVFYKEYQKIKKAQKSAKFIRNNRQEEDNLE